MYFYVEYLSSVIYRRVRDGYLQLINSREIILDSPVA